MQNNNWQFVSLELAKKMRDLGFKQESMMWWGNTIGQVDQSCWRIQKKDDDQSMEYISAFSVAELGEMLSGHIKISKMINGTWSIHWTDTKMNEYSKYHLEKADTLIDCMAKMLIYLKEQGII